MWGHWKETITEHIHAVYTKVERLEAIAQDTREWVELLVDERKPDPDAVADRFMARLQERVKAQGKSLTSQQMRDLLKETLQE